MSPTKAMPVDLTEDNGVGAGVVHQATQCTRDALRALDALLDFNAGVAG